MPTAEIWLGTKTEGRLTFWTVKCTCGELARTKAKPGAEAVAKDHAKQAHAGDVWIHTPT